MHADCHFFIRIEYVCHAPSLVQPLQGAAQPARGPRRDNFDPPKILIARFGAGVALEQTCVVPTGNYLFQSQLVSVRSRGPAVDGAPTLAWLLLQNIATLCQKPSSERQTHARRPQLQQRTSVSPIDRSTSPRCTSRASKLPSTMLFTTIAASDCVCTSSRPRPNTWSTNWASIKLSIIVGAN